MIDGLPGHNTPGIFPDPVAGIHIAVEHGKVTTGYFQTDAVLTE
jgi:hypothetical protein